VRAPLLILDCHSEKIESRVREIPPFLFSPSGFWAVRMVVDLTGACRHSTVVHWAAPCPTPHPPNSPTWMRSSISKRSPRATSSVSKTTPRTRTTPLKCSRFRKAKATSTITSPTVCASLDSCYTHTSGSDVYLHAFPAPLRVAYPAAVQFLLWHSVAEMLVALCCIRMQAATRTRR
jgi:hypothetical protein